MIGGSGAFIRRPFLYTGLWYGIGGGLAAALAGPMAQLSGLYGSTFALSGLGPTGVVGRHLKDIEPA